MNPFFWLLTELGREESHPGFTLTLTKLLALASQAFIMEQTLFFRMEDIEQRQLGRGPGATCHNCQFEALPLRISGCSDARSSIRFVLYSPTLGTHDAGNNTICLTWLAMT